MEKEEQKMNTSTSCVLFDFFYLCGTNVQHTVFDNHKSTPPPPFTITQQQRRPKHYTVKPKYSATVCSLQFVAVN
jgi:hypothetical protein